MVRRTPLISIATVNVASLLHNIIPVHGHEVTLYARAGKDIGGKVGTNVITKFFLQSWVWAAIVVVSIAFLSLAFLFLKAFFMHLNKHPRHLFPGEPDDTMSGIEGNGDARMGQLFCTLTVLSLFFMMAYFPMFLVFTLLPLQYDNLPQAIMTTTSPVAMMNSASGFGGALTTGALLALISHRHCLHFGRGKGMPLWKKAVDLAIVSFIIIFTVILTVLYGLLPTFQSMMPINTLNAMAHLYNAFYAMAVLDIFYLRYCCGKG